MSPELVAMSKGLLKMTHRKHAFDENYYAYYYDETFSDQSNLLASIYMGNQMHTTNNKGKLFVISGPSGVGKTTLASVMFAKLGRTHNLSRVITYTTKSPRVGEQNGVDYHFISVLEFESKLASGFFIEYSKAYGHYYGSPKSIITELGFGKSFLLVVDKLGAQSIKRQYQPAVLIWLTPPSIAELAKRLGNRATDSVVEIEKRLLIARDELATSAEKTQFDYIIENNELAKSISNLLLILKAEISSGSIDS